ncbi:MAG: hypothetical protein ACRDTD_14280 [Pseudonocardiaceae bacterium]
MRDEYGPLSALTLHLEDCDAVIENPQCADAVVRTLVTAQVLRYATRYPTQANPSYVVGLGMFADELIPSLLKEHPQTSPETARRLHEIRGEIAELCMGLAVLAAPGMPQFPDV